MIMKYGWNLVEKLRKKGKIWGIGFKLIDDFYGIWIVIYFFRNREKYGFWLCEYYFF